jgi:hypothetical protein
VGGHGDGWYLVATNGDPAADSYLMILNRDGVPVWYRQGAPGRQPRNLERLANGDLWWFEAEGFAFGTNPANGYDRRTLDGTLVRTYRVSPPDATNHHDAHELANGNVLVMSMPLETPTEPRPCVTPTGQQVSATYVAGALIEELLPDGTSTGRMWSARPQAVPDATTISLSETTVPLCFVRQVGGVTEYLLSAVHPNGFSVRGDTVVLSARHADALYAIDWTDAARGTIRWKLGGTARPGVSLQLVGDPGGGTFRQHDPEVLANGDVTVFDNRTVFTGIPSISAPTGAARFVQYRIDETARTATFVRQVADPSGRNSGALGSARLTDDGGTVLGWGANGSGQILSDIGPNGEVRFTVLMSGTTTSYRAAWEPAAAFDVDQLRQTAGR